jgi:hypothetical protein
MQMHTIGDANYFASPKRKKQMKPNANNQFVRMRAVIFVHPEKVNNFYKNDETARLKMVEKPELFTKTFNAMTLEKKVETLRILANLSYRHEYYNELESTKAKQGKYHKNRYSSDMSILEELGIR